MKNLKIFLMVITAILVVITTAPAAITSNGSGVWSSTGTWVGGVVPTSTDDVIIASGHIITVDVSTAACNNISFADTTAHLIMGISSSVLNVYGNFSPFSTFHTPFSSWVDGAVLKFTGGTAIQNIDNIRNANDATTMAFFKSIVIDKSGGKVTISGEADAKLNISNSIEVVNGTFELPSAFDINGRSFLGTTAAQPTITVYAGGTFTMLGGASQIMSRPLTDPPGKIGKVTIYGNMTVTTSSTNLINFNDVDVESGGTLTIETGWTSGKFAPGTVTIKSGGIIYNTTTTNIWATGSVVVLNNGGVYKTSSSTTAFPPTFTNNGTVRYQRNTSASPVDQTIVDMNYYRLEISFSNTSGKKIWTLASPRTISDSLEVNNSAILQLLGTSSPTVNNLLRLTTGNLDNSTRNIILANGATISRATGTIQVAPTFGSTVNLRYTSTSLPVTTGPEIPTSTSVLNNLYLTTTKTVTLGANATVNGTFTLGDTAIINPGSYSLNYGPSATLQYGLSGTVQPDTTSDIEWPATGGPQNVTIYNNGGVILHGNRTVNGTLTLTLGTFDNNGLLDDKVLTIANGASISRARGELSVAPTFAGLVNVAYTSGVVDVVTGYELPTSSSALNNITLNTAKVVKLNADATVNGSLILTNGMLSLGSSNLTLAASATIGGSPFVTSMVDPEGSGELRKVFTGTGSFTYPVGDTSGTREYSPVTLNFTSGGFSSAYAGVKLVNAKHPSNSSTTDYLNRYWTVTQNGISSFSCNADFVYADGDIVGSTESNITLGKWDGANWINYGTGSIGTNTLSALAVTGFSDFTGGQLSVLPVQIVSFVGNFIGANSVKLEWQTISEVNNYGFNVQRRNGNEYVTAGFVAGKGTTLEPQSYSFVDENATGSVEYRLEQIDNNGLKNYFGPIMLNPNSVANDIVPAVFKLNQNYPNPFNPSTKISFSLAENGYTSLKIYNILGREVATLLAGNAEAGKRYVVNFGAENLPSGLYFSKLQSGNTVEIRKMTFIK